MLPNEKTAPQSLRANNTSAVSFDSINDSIGSGITSKEVKITNHDAVSISTLSLVNNVFEKRALDTPQTWISDNDSGVILVILFFIL